MTPGLKKLFICLYALTVLIACLYIPRHVYNKYWDTSIKYPLHYAYLWDNSRTVEIARYVYNGKENIWRNNTYHLGNIDYERVFLEIIIITALYVICYIIFDVLWRISHKCNLSNKLHKVIILATIKVKEVATKKKLKLSLIFIVPIIIVSGYYSWQIDRHEKALIISHRSLQQSNMVDGFNVWREGKKLQRTLNSLYNQVIYIDGSLLLGLIIFLFTYKEKKQSPKEKQEDVTL